MSRIPEMVLGTLNLKATTKNYKTSLLILCSESYALSGRKEKKSLGFQ